MGASEEEKEREGEKERRERPESASSKCRSAEEAGEVVEMSEQSEKAMETEACNTYILNIQYKKTNNMYYTTSALILYLHSRLQSSPPPFPGATAMVDGARSMCGVHSVHASERVFFFEIEQRMVGKGEEKDAKFSLVFWGVAYNSLIFLSVSKHPSASTSIALTCRYLPTSHPTPQPMHRKEEHPFRRTGKKEGGPVRPF